MKNVWIWTDVLAPGLAAQLFAVVLIYLLLVRKRMTGGYRLYAVFLGCLIFMLGGRAMQSFLRHPWVWYLNWSRMGLFMAVGVPSLFIVSARQAGINPGRRLYSIPFIVGSVLALSYMVLQDLRLQSMNVLPEEWGAGITTVHVHITEWLAWLGMLAVPNLLFVWKEWQGRRNPTHIAFMSGSILFGILMALGIWKEMLALYYVGSMLCAAVWIWAMFRHVRQMKGRVGLLKEELEWQVHSGRVQGVEEIEQQLSELEALSQGDLALYKLRMRDILSSFTEAAIRAGGDSAELMERTAEREKMIEQSEDPQSVRELLSEEAVELSGMITEIQQKKETVTIQKAKEFIKQEYDRDLGIDEIAEHLGISRAYFMREFKKQTGQTVNRYLTGLRMEKAKELLVTQTVTETAFDVGYNHANYFSTVFKKETGMSPVEYKKQAVS